jgi:mRNA-degrading endonuclease toxin of MazEF toxin-antitoxin module
MGIEYSQDFFEARCLSPQQIQTISTVKLERRLGALTKDEMERVLAVLARRLGI